MDDLADAAETKEQATERVSDERASEEVVEVRVVEPSTTPQRGPRASKEIVLQRKLEAVEDKIKVKHEVINSLALKAAAQVLNKQDLARKRSAEDASGFHNTKYRIIKKSI